ncbi:MAG: hypothetical protein PHX77_08200 [Candidatus Bipolaricaulis sp.]|nr:hypothetical protein [Candidatus Bipolaricaulis sp.]MDD5646451.1 hypothetical protein [Candidatus Bipolaricaulis sp.]
MDRDAVEQTAHDACVRPLGGRCAADDRTSTRRPARGAWLIRAAVVTYLVANAVVAYLTLSAV